METPNGIPASSGSFPFDAVLSPTNPLGQPRGLPFALRLPNRALDTLICARLDLAVLRAKRCRDAPLLLLSVPSQLEKTILASSG